MYPHYYITHFKNTEVSKFTEQKLENNKLIEIRKMHFSAKKIDQNVKLMCFVGP